MALPLPCPQGPGRLHQLHSHWKERPAQQCSSLTVLNVLVTSMAFLTLVLYVSPYLDCVLQLTIGADVYRLCALPHCLLKSQVTLLCHAHLLSHVCQRQHAPCLTCCCLSLHKYSMMVVHKWPRKRAIASLSSQHIWVHHRFMLQISVPNADVTAACGSTTQLRMRLRICRCVNSSSKVAAMGRQNWPFHQSMAFMMLLEKGKSTFSPLDFPQVSADR